MSLDETSPEKLREVQAIGRECVAAGKGADDCRALAQVLMGRGAGTPLKAREAMKQARLRPRLAEFFHQLTNKVRSRL